MCRHKMYLLSALYKYSNMVYCSICASACGHVRTYNQVQRGTFSLLGRLEEIASR